MSWNTWQTKQWGYPQPWKAKTPKKAPEQKKPSGPVVTGYDGTKVSFGASSSQSTGKTSKETSSTEDGIQELKNMFVEMLKKNGETDHPWLAKHQEDEERDKLRQEQKDLNQRRKNQRRIDMLKKQITSREQSFQEWKKGMKATIKSEEERCTKEVNQLKEDLEKMLNGEEEDEGMVSDESSDAEATRLKHEKQEMEKKLAEANIRCQRMYQENQEINRKMDIILSNLHHVVPADEPLLPNFELMTPPMVTSPENAGKKPTGLKPFRRARDARDGPYTPKVTRLEEKIDKRQEDDVKDGMAEPTMEPQQEPKGEDGKMKSTSAVEDLEWHPRRYRGMRKLKAPSYPCKG